MSASSSNSTRTSGMNPATKYVVLAGLTPENASPCARTAPSQAAPKPLRGRAAGGCGSHRLARRRARRRPRGPSRSRRATARRCRPGGASPPARAAPCRSRPRGVQSARHGNTKPGARTPCRRYGSCVSAAPVRGCPRSQPECRHSDRSLVQAQPRSMLHDMIETAAAANGRRDVASLLDFKSGPVP